MPTDASLLYDLRAVVMPMHGFVTCDPDLAASLLYACGSTPVRLVEAVLSPNNVIDGVCGEDHRGTRKKRVDCRDGNPGELSKPDSNRNDSHSL